MKAALLLPAVAAIAMAQQPADKGVNFYSLEREIALGDAFADQFRQTVTATTDPRLDRIGARLTVQTTRFQYRFFVFDGGVSSTDLSASAASPADWRRLRIDEAIAVAGGTIFVPRHLLARDDAQLAAILAHAIGHVELRNATRAMTHQELIVIGMQTAQLATWAPVGANTQIELATLKLHRNFELAADLFAVPLLHKAGFDPAGLVAWLRGLPPPARIAFSPYPAPEHRAAAAEKAIAELVR
jgi:predicted Zn-dependent protease